MRMSRLVGVLVIMHACILPNLCRAAAADSDGLVRKDTWLQTLIASRDARALRDDEETRQRAAAGSFAPFSAEMTTGDPPRAIRLKVEGLKQLFIGANGRCEAFLGDARLIHADGKATPIASSGLRGIRGSFRHDLQVNWTPVTCGGREFKTGVCFRESEFSVDIPAKAQWLEATVGVIHREKRSTRIWINRESAYEREDRNTASLEKIWQGMAASESQNVARQFRIEHAAGIWALGSGPTDFSELARRYAGACAAPQREAAAMLASACRNLADLQPVRDLFYVQHAQARMVLAKQTLAFVERSVARPAFAAELAALEKRIADVSNSGQGAESLFNAACDLRRKIILSHPLLDFDRLLINKRSGNLPEHMCDQFLGRHSQRAEGLVMLENWRSRPVAEPLLEGRMPPGGVIHPDLSFDGQRILFAFAEHSSAIKNSRERGYFIWEYSLATGQVRQVTGTERDPKIGQKDRQTVLIEDMDPCYLPDGGIAFISTRSQQFGRCHGGRYVPSYTLYRSELDGSGIRPLSFNESNEWGPSVLNDGSIVYTRWDYVNRHDTIFQSLWVTRPDGTQTAHYYGNNSRAPCFTGEALAIPGSHKTVSTAAAHHGQTLGTLITVDPFKGQEDGQPLVWITPELAFPESGVPDGIVKTAMPLPGDLPFNVESSRGTRAATPFPLSEDLYLCTYQHGAQCAIFLVDTLGGRELIFQDPSISCFDPIPLRPRPTPPAIASTVADTLNQKTGVFYIEDVYQSTESIPRGTIQRMRINEIISQPTSSFPVRSHAENEIVKKVLGTVAVNPDGSAAFEAPANTPIQLQLLDENQMAVMTMRSLVYLQPGERASCVGCHESRYSAPPVSRMPSTAVQAVVPPAGPHYEGGFSFPRTVQPVLDRYCIACHGLDRTEGNIDLTGSFDVPADPAKKHAGRFSVAYDALIASGMVKVAPRNGETAISKPKDYFAHAGRLAKMLLDGHPDKQGHKRIEMDRVSLHRVIDWLDLNAQFYGDYSFNRIEQQPPLADGEKALRAAIERRFGADLAKQPYAALVNKAMPTESRVLMAPLPTKAGGWGQIISGAYAVTDDPAYQDMRRLVENSITPLKYRDIAGTCGRDDKCVCGVCWVRKDNAARRHTAAK